MKIGSTVTRKGFRQRAKIVKFFRRKPRMAQLDRKIGAWLVWPVDELVEVAPRGPHQVVYQSIRLFYDQKWPRELVCVKCFKTFTRKPVSKAACRGKG